MQKADQADTRSAGGGSPDNSPESIVRIVDPLGELADIVAYSQIVGTLVACARSEIELINNDYYYVAPGAKPSLTRIDHLLTAIEIVHETEMRRAENVEIGLYERGVPALMQRLAA